MAFNTNFSPLGDYTPPEVKLEIKLKPYDKPPTNKTPVLKGYVMISKSQLKSIERVIDASASGQTAFLQVALWDSVEGGGVEGVIEYKEYTPKVKAEVDAPPTNSIWY